MFVSVSTCSDHFTLSNFDCLTFLRSNPVMGVGLVMPARRYGGQTLPKKYRVPLENVSAIILVVIHFCTSGVLWRNGNIVARGRRKPKRYLKQVAKSANESITKFFFFFLLRHTRVQRSLPQRLQTHLDFYVTSRLTWTERHNSATSPLDLSKSSVCLPNF